MALRNQEPRSEKLSNLWWVLILLVLGVLTLSILAFASPVFQNRQAVTPSPTELANPPTGETDANLHVTQTAEAEALPPTPEEIGFTDGIIFMSTVLILILLLATLRETILNKNR